MHQQTRSSLVQIMAYHLISAKLLSDPILKHCYLDPGVKIQWIFFIENQTFSFEKNVFKILSAKQRPFCIDHNVSSVMLAKLSPTKQSSVCWRTGHSLIELLTESLTHLLTDWITIWLIDCLIDWLAHPYLGSLKNREDCYTRWTPRNKYSLVFLICSVTMGWSKWNLPWNNRDVEMFG